MPDYTGFLRIGKMVSVLVSIADPSPSNSLLHTQLELEAEVRIAQSPFYLAVLFVLDLPIFDVHLAVGAFLRLRQGGFISLRSIKARAFSRTPNESG